MWVFALVVLAIVGCNEVVTPPDTVELQLLVKDKVVQIALEGAQICQTDTTNCVRTDASGGATLKLPANQKLSYTVEKEGYGSLLYPLFTGAAPTIGKPNMDADAWLADNLANLQSSYPLRDTGAINVILVPRFAGATFELVDATGTAYYEDEEDNWSPDLKATTLGGPDEKSRFGEGGFVEVGRGEFQVEIGGTGQGCRLDRSDGTTSGWPGDTPNRIEVPVREGFFTRAIMQCPTPP